MSLQILQNINLKNNEVKFVIHEPAFSIDVFDVCEVIENFGEFADMSDVVIVNLLDDNMKSIEDKFYMRDYF